MIRAILFIVNKAKIKTSLNPRYGLYVKAYFKSHYLNISLLGFQDGFLFSAFLYSVFVFR